MPKRRRKQVDSKNPNEKSPSTRGELWQPPRRRDETLDDVDKHALHSGCPSDDDEIDSE